MEIKKSEKANLENKKLLFIEIGLIISLAITYVAFEWTSTETNVSTLEAEAEVVLEEEIITILCLLWTLKTLCSSWVHSAECRIPI